MSSNDTKSKTAHSVVVDLHNLYKKSGSLAGLAIWVSAFALFCWVVAFIFLPMIMNADGDVITPDSVRERAIFVLAFVSIFAALVVLLMNAVYLGIQFLQKRKELQRNFLQVQADLVRRSYVTNFELEESQGTSQVDKIFNHLCLVFPQLNDEKKKRLKKGFTTFDQKPGPIWSRFRRKVFFLKRYDLAQRTSTGFFIVKIINDKPLSFTDVEKELASFQKRVLVESAGMSSSKDLVSRFIFLAKSYDDTFSENTLREKMKSLKRTFLVDLIKEDEYGYSTIWID